MYHWDQEKTTGSRGQAGGGEASQLTLQMDSLELALFLPNFV